jgi:hypothetical protein
MDTEALVNKRARLAKELARVDDLLKNKQSENQLKWLTRHRIYNDDNDLKFYKEPGNYLSVVYVTGRSRVCLKFEVIGIDNSLDRNLICLDNVIIDGVKSTERLTLPEIQLIAAITADFMGAHDAALIET